MTQVARKGDLCTGHGGFPPRPSLTGSEDVFINGKPVHRTTDSWAPHTDGTTVHPSTMGQGLSTVLVNGLAIARVGDPVQCGSTILLGSLDVYAGP
jgi:uncharacterized Zn-binding protein involved in type VI secretion